MTPPRSSSRPIGVGVIGTGFGKTTQIPAFLATPGYRVVAVASHTRSKAEATAREFGIPHAFTADELDDFLAVDDLDLVSISSPPATHCDYTRRAFAAGKHVLCEKPTALDAGEARDMVEAWRASRRLGLVDHELRFDGARRRLRDLVSEGFLGRLHHVTIVVESPFRLDPERAWSWWSDRGQGGGVLGAVGSHVVDAVRYTFGELVATRAQLETAIGERPDPAAGGALRPVTADDYAALWLRLENGALVSAVISSVSRSPAPGWRMSAHGSASSLVLDTDGTLRGQRAGESEFSDLTPPRPPFDAQALRLPDTPWSRSFLLFAAAIARALGSGEAEVPDAATLEDGLRSQEVLDAARVSAADERWVACAPREGATSRR